MGFGVLSCLLPYLLVYHLLYLAASRADADVGHDFLSLAWTGRNCLRWQRITIVVLFCYHRFTRGDFHVRSNIANKDAPLVAGVTLLILQGVAEAVSAPLGAGDREAVVGG